MEILRLIQVLLALSFTTYGLFICLYGLVFYQFFVDSIWEKMPIYIINTLVFYQLILYVINYISKILIKGTLFHLKFY